MNTKFLYVDDERDCPEGWDIARDYDDAMLLLRLNDYDIISLDHDIASYNAEGNEQTGYDILNRLEYDRIVLNLKIPHIYIHTANAAVAAKMRAVADKLNKMGAP